MRVRGQECGPVEAPACLGEVAPDHNWISPRKGQGKPCHMPALPRQGPGERLTENRLRPTDRIGTTNKPDPTPILPQPVPGRIYGAANLGLRL